MSTTLYLRFPKSIRPSNEVEVSSQKEVIIGRADSCDINLSQYYRRLVRHISKEHYKIHWRNGQFVIVDLESTNGTWVNGTRLRARRARRLRNGDVIKVANHAHLIAVVQIRRFINPEDTEPIPPDPLLASLLEPLQKERDVMLLGVAGMGKTTLLSRLIPQNETQDVFDRFWADHHSFLFCGMVHFGKNLTCQLGRHIQKHSGFGIRNSGFGIRDSGRINRGRINRGRIKRGKSFM